MKESRTQEKQRLPERTAQQKVWHKVEEHSQAKCGLAERKLEKYIPRPLFPPNALLLLPLALAKPRGDHRTREPGGCSL